MTNDQFKDKVRWTIGDSGNVYANFGDMVDQRPHGEEMPQPPIGSAKWKTLLGEMTSKLSPSVKFASAPSPDGPFNRVAPSHFKPMELTGYGADVATLPKPAVTSPEADE